MRNTRRHIASRNPGPALAIQDAQGGGVNVGDTWLNMAPAHVHIAAGLCAIIGGLFPGTLFVGRKVPMIFCRPLMSTCLMCC